MVAVTIIYYVWIFSDFGIGVAILRKIKFVEQKA